MGEHNLLNPGFVGPLVNIHTGDTFYFPNFRASGAQLPGLPSLSYPRRDNVCSLPWPSAEPCNGYPQPYLGSPVSLNPPFGRTCELARVEDSKGYYREPCAESGGGGLKREERGRDPGPGVGPGAALLPLEPIGFSGGKMTAGWASFFGSGFSSGLVSSAGAGVGTGAASGTGSGLGAGVGTGTTTGNADWDIGLSGVFCSCRGAGCLLCRFFCDFADGRLRCCFAFCASRFRIFSMKVCAWAG